MEFVKLSKEEVLKASDYVPTEEKKRFIDDVSTKCVKKVAISVDEPGKYSVPMPDYYIEDQFMIYRYLMGAFAKLYLGKEFEPVEGTEFLMAQDDFDRWSGGHVFNQIDRMKRDPDLKQKCFDILEDYSNLRRMLYNEIHALLGVMIDPCQRIMAMIQMQTTPEAMQDGVQQLEVLREQLEAYTAQRGDTDAASAT